MKQQRAGLSRLSKRKQIVDVAKIGLIRQDRKKEEDMELALKINTLPQKLKTEEI